MNYTLGTMLRYLVKNKPKQWDLALLQTEFAYNSLPNQFTGKAPFTIVYSKPPNHTTNIPHLPTPTNRDAESFANIITSTFTEFHSKLIKSTAKYKVAIDLHHRSKVFQEGELVMVYLQKARFPIGEFYKLQPCKFGPFQVLRRINDNAYIIELQTD